MGHDPVGIDRQDDALLGNAECVNVFSEAEQSPHHVRRTRPCEHLWKRTPAPSSPCPQTRRELFADSTRSPRVSKSDCLARSVIGRVVSVGGGRIFCRRIHRQ